MTLDFSVKLKYQSSAITLSVFNIYSVRDILCDVINPQRSDIYASHTLNDVCVPSGIGPS